MYIKQLFELYLIKFLLIYYDLLTQIKPWCIREIQNVVLLVDIQLNY